MISDCNQGHRKTRCLISYHDDQAQSFSSRTREGRREREKRYKNEKSFTCRGHEINCSCCHSDRSETGFDAVHRGHFPPFALCCRTRLSRLPMLLQTVLSPPPGLRQAHFALPLVKEKYERKVREIMKII